MGWFLMGFDIYFIVKYGNLHCYEIVVSLCVQTDFTSYFRNFLKVKVLFACVS